MRVDIVFDLCVWLALVPFVGYGIRDTYRLMKELDADERV